MKKNKVISFLAALCITGQMIPAGLASVNGEQNEKDFIYGDINSDGAADLTDLSLLSIFLMGGTEFSTIQLKAADVDGNNENDIRDLAHFKRYICKEKVTLGPQYSSLLKIKPASDYKDLYPLMANNYGYAAGGFVDYDYLNGELPVSTYANSAQAGGTSAPTRDTSVKADDSMSVSNEGSNSTEHSDTHNQEENVLESDIVKTDGNAIYSLSSNYYYNSNPILKTVYVKDGKFEKTQNIELDLSCCTFGTVKSVDATNMYLYNDMIIILGTANINSNTISNKKKQNNDIYYRSASKIYTFVSAYKKGTENKAPELINTYYQEGSFNDVRITPDGYMYLITDGGFNYRYYYGWLDYGYAVNKAVDDSAESVDETDEAYDEDEIIEQIPTSGTNEGVVPAPLNNIYIPENIDDTYSSTYTIVGSVNLNSSDKIENKDLKVITGYTGEIYCHENNLYLTHERYDSFYSKSGKRTSESSHEVTEITRLALSEGNVTPEATGEVPGYVNDQFSMSEFDGNFRIVTTCNYYHYSYNDDDCYYYSFEDSSERSNNVFVLDKDLKKIGEISHFAKDEMVKSVTFDGNIGYVVTFVQTDPLFAVDFSDPANPTILDEFKIDGFSTYMQKWDDGHLLGFGKTVTDSIEDGYKIVMFDNSDPENLKEDGIYEIRNYDPQTLAEILGKSNFIQRECDTSCWLYSEATYERKALLIAPEKNLIGIPLNYDIYLYNDDDTWYEKYYQSGSGYCFFSYEDGDFKFKNFLGDSNDDDYNYYYTEYNRALYIGDYVYIVANSKIMSADIDTCTKVDEIKLINYTDDEYAPNVYITE